MDNQKGELCVTPVTRIDGIDDNLQIIQETCDIIVEAPILIDVADMGSYTVMALPQDIRPLAVGFLMADDVISNIDDIALLTECPDDPNIIRIRLTKPPLQKTNRNLTVTSSCGLCGNTAISKLLDSLNPVSDNLRINVSNIHKALKQMHKHQELFARTGGTHAAAIFDCSGTIIAFAEDIGRHNALDKAIGKCVLASLELNGHGVALSGRVSLEMVIKCARAGIELIAAISAPTSLAISAAVKNNITLCAYVRKDRLTIFGHPYRISESNLKNDI